uniref:SCAN box domain-containing protein n=1 Tax=Crocodylus porosus TaxID=8502 RepID=A0A7M4ESF4_CROPO
MPQPLPLPCIFVQETLFEIAPEFYHQQFRARKKAEERWPRLLAQTMRNLLEWWIQPAGKTVAEILGLFTLEQFLEDLDEKTQCWVRKYQPEGVEEALQLAETFTAAKKVGSQVKSHKVAGAPAPVGAWADNAHKKTADGKNITNSI